jgi:hypothetical protein
MAVTGEGEGECEVARDRRPAERQRERLCEGQRGKGARGAAAGTKEVASNWLG